MPMILTGLLTKDTPTFMNSLWKLLLEAQTDMVGVPRTFLQQKCEEHEKLTLVFSMNGIVVLDLMDSIMEIVADVVAEISEVEAVVDLEDAVGDVADSTITMEGTEIVFQDGVTEVVVRAVSVVVCHPTSAFVFTNLM
jgi:hypothetical protein